MTRVEFSSAVAKWVRMGELEDRHADILASAFEKDVATGLFRVREVKPGFFRQAERWLLRRAMPRRTLDALHLACCGAMTRIWSPATRQCTAPPRLWESSPHSWARGRRQRPHKCHSVI